MDEKDSVETIEKFIEGDEATNAFESNQNSKRKKMKEE